MVLESQAVKNNLESGGWITFENNGVYMVASDGRLFVETDISRQKHYDNFKFKTGDVIKVTYDLYGNTIEFIVQN